MKHDVYWNGFHNSFLRSSTKDQMGKNIVKWKSFVKNDDLHKLKSDGVFFSLLSYFYRFAENKTVFSFISSVSFITLLAVWFIFQKSCGIFDER